MTKLTASLIISVAAIGCITAIELYALSRGMNGVILAGALALIAGIAGYEAKAIIQFMKPTKPPE